MEIFSYLVNALSPYHLAVLLFGMVFGIIIGAIPGLTPTLGVALLIPMTFRMTPEAGLIVLGAVYVGAVYGGHIPAVLINIPGAPAAIATTFDGFPMNKKGLGQQALNVGVFSSFIGGTVGAVSLFLFAPLLATLTLKFGPAENFWVAAFGIAVIASLAADNFWKGIASGAFGLLLSAVGTSTMTGLERFTFGNSDLIGGISVVPALIGMFSIPQVINLLNSSANKIVESDFLNKKNGSLFKDALEVVRRPVALVLASIIGVIVGIIPGAGGQVGGVVSYDWVRRFSKDKEEFGKGHPEGVIASQTSANAVVGGSLVPLLTLGIPGSPSAAVLLGGLLIHGLFPGADLFTTHADVTYTFLWSLILAHIVLIPLGLAGARMFCKVALVPNEILAPAVLVLSIYGTFALSNNVTDVAIMLVLGTLYYFGIKLGFSPVATVLGLILGSYAETGFLLTRRVGMAHGSVTDAFFQSPISIILIVLIIFSILPTFWAMFCDWKNKKKKDNLSEADGRGITMTKWNVISGGAVLVISIALYLYSSGYDPEVAVFPKFVLVVMGLASAALFIQNLLVKKNDDKRIPFAGFGLKNVVTVAIVLCAGVCYEHLGFYTALLTTMIAMPFLKYWKVEPFKPAALKRLIPVSILMAVIMYLVFDVALGIQMPRGLFI